MKLNLLKLIGSLLPKSAPAARQAVNGTEFKAVFKETASAPPAEQSNSNAGNKPPADKSAVLFAPRYSEQHVQTDNKLSNSSKLPAEAAKLSPNKAETRSSVGESAVRPNEVQTMTLSQSHDSGPIRKLGNVCAQVQSSEGETAPVITGRKIEATLSQGTVSTKPLARPHVSVPEQTVGEVAQSTKIVVDTASDLKQPDLPQVTEMSAATTRGTTNGISHPKPGVRMSQVPIGVSAQEVPKQQAPAKDVKPDVPATPPLRASGLAQARQARRNESFRLTASRREGDSVRQTRSPVQEAEGARTNVSEQVPLKAVLQPSNVFAAAFDQAHVAPESQTNLKPRVALEEGATASATKRNDARVSRIANVSIAMPNGRPSPQNVPSATAPSLAPVNEPKEVVVGRLHSAPVRNAVSNENSAPTTVRSVVQNQTRDHLAQVESREKTSPWPHKTDITHANATGKAPTQDPVVSRDIPLQEIRQSVTVSAGIAAPGGNSVTVNAARMRDEETALPLKMTSAAPQPNDTDSVITRISTAKRGDKNDSLGKQSVETPSNGKLSQNATPATQYVPPSAGNIVSNEATSDSKSQRMRPAEPRLRNDVDQGMLKKDSAKHSTEQWPKIPDAHTRKERVSLSGAKGTDVLRGILATESKEGLVPAAEGRTTGTQDIVGKVSSEYPMRSDLRTRQNTQTNAAAIGASKTLHDAVKSSTSSTDVLPFTTPNSHSSFKGSAETARNRSGKQDKTLEVRETSERPRSPQSLNEIESISKSEPKRTSPAPSNALGAAAQRHDGSREIAVTPSTPTSAIGNRVTAPESTKEAVRVTSEERASVRSVDKTTGSEKRDAPASKAAEVARSQLRTTPSKVQERPLQVPVSTEKLESTTANDHAHVPNVQAAFAQSNALPVSTVQNDLLTNRPRARAEQWDNIISRDDAHQAADRAEPKSLSMSDGASERVSSSPLRVSSGSGAQFEGNTGLSNAKPSNPNRERTDTKGIAREELAVPVKRPIEAGAVSSGKTGQDHVKQSTAEQKPQEPARKSGEIGYVAQKEPETATSLRAENTQSKQAVEPNTQQTTSFTAAQKNIEGIVETVPQRSESLPRVAQPEAMKAALQQALEMSRKRLVEPDELRLSMPFGELGTLDIDVARQSETYSIHIAAEPSVAAVLEESKVALLSWMREQGYAVERLDLSVRLDLQSQSSTGGDRQSAHGAERQSHVRGTASHVLVGDEGSVQATARPDHSGAHVWTA